MRWIKKNVPREVVKELHTRFSCDALVSSILARRGITEGKDILFFLENDTRFLHNPFLFSTMEDAVERILDAKEDNAKVLVFGDRDVDGVTSTMLLVNYLKSIDIDVQWKLPSGDEGYGLSIDVVDEFASEYGSLIITVDCGISNNKEIEYACSLGLNVIVVDHHNPPLQLPEGAIIVNPKMPDSGYPFIDISGCAVTYKLVTALRFSKQEIFNQEICLLNCRPVNDAFVIEAVKIRNLVDAGRIEETIVPGAVSIQHTRLPQFLRGQAIYVWDEALQRKMLAKTFGNGVEFNMLDIRPEIAKLIPTVANLSLLRIKDLSRIVRYNDTPSSELDGFFNIFVSYIKMKIKKQFPADFSSDAEDLQLTMLSALADIMPLKNENRILVRKGLESINNGNIRNGLKELLARQNMLGKRISSTDLSWSIIPILNAAGRLGQPELAVNLFMADNPKERDCIAEKIINLNKERRQYGIDAWNFAEKPAHDSLGKYGNKLVVVIDKRIFRGITGILASKLVQYYKVPGIAMTIVEENTVVGSIRSTRGYDVTGILDACHDLFINAGGHNFAAGFSLVKENLNEFLARLEKTAPLIEFKSEETDETTEIDAELPHEFIKPELLDIIDKFEPYGCENPQLVFTASKIRIINADIIGHSEAKHLKLTLDCGKNKWPAVYWNAASRLKVDFDVGDFVDILFRLNRNTFNGTESPQMILLDVKKSGEKSYDVN